MKRSLKIVYYLILLAGIVLRLIPYLLNRSLWLDEASIALNITDRSFAGLLHPLDYNQVAPVLFLFIEKFNTIVFSNCEQSLRLFPLLCGLLNLPLVFRLTKQLSGNNVAASIALFLFAVSPVLIDYSNEVKQYESDVFSTLCLLLLVVDGPFSTRPNKRLILLAIVGSVLIFLSNITVLVLVTISIYYVFTYKLALIKQRGLLVVFTCWIISFAVNFFVFIYHHPTRAFMLSYWQNDFVPVQLFSILFWEWMDRKFTSVFNIFYSQLYLLFIASGLLFILKKQWRLLYFLMFPMLLHFIISGFQIYPFEIRLILYLAAFIIPAMAIGFAELIPILKKYLTIYPVIVLSGILIYGTIAELANSPYPFYKEEIKKSIAFITANKQPGEQQVYAYYATRDALTYYIETKGVSFKNNLVWGTDGWDWKNRDLCYNDICKLHGKVWLLFSHVYTSYGSDEDITLEHLANSKAVILKSFKTKGSSVYLVKLDPAE